MTSENHERQFRGGAAQLRSADRIARLEVERVVTLSLEGLTAPRVLDIGTGTGVFAEAFAARGLPAVGIDPNDDLLKVARKVVPAADFVEASAESIPYPDQSFGLAFLGHILHETDDAVAALREAGRISTKRVVVLEWPYVREEHGPPLEHRLRPEEVLKIAKRAGLDHVEHLKLTHMDLYRMPVGS